MIEHHTAGSTRRLTLGADKGYDAKPFAAELRALNVTPHIARHDAVTKTDSGEHLALMAADHLIRWPRLLAAAP